MEKKQVMTVSRQELDRTQERGYIGKKHYANPKKFN